MAFRLRNSVLTLGGRTVTMAFQNVSIEVHREPIAPIYRATAWEGSPLAIRVVTTDDVLLCQRYDVYSDLPTPEPPKRTLEQRIAGINASVAAKLERRRELGW